MYRCNEKVEKFDLCYCVKKQFAGMVFLCCISFISHKIVISLALLKD